MYGLEGVLTFRVDGKMTEVAAGEACFILRGAVHGFNNLKQEDAKALAVITSALLGSIFFKEIAEIVNAGGPPDIEKIKQIMAKHGLVPVLRKMQKEAIL